MKEVVGLIFSKDRAMQLDATIQSLSRHCQDMQTISMKVIYAISTLENKQQYETLATAYPQVEFIKEVDFESQVIGSITSYQYVLFLVDDNIFVRDFSIKHIVESLALNPDALGFSLRLGTNIKYCYPLRKDQQLPEFSRMDHGFLVFDWTLAEYDFGYPLEISSSIYRVKDIIDALQDSFCNPNTLEAYLDGQKKIFYHKKFLLCNQYSYTFCNPVNKVQTIFNNRAGEIFYYDPGQLSELFRKGYRVQWEDYSGFIPNACHQEVELKFKKMDQASIPKVSVIIPVYNEEEYVGQAIESILNQTFSDFECIIIDDGSTDHTLNIIKTYHDPRISLVHNETNLKLIATLNKGLSLARGQYLARMDADDISLPERLAMQVEFMDQNPRVGVCGTWAELFGECESSFWRFTDQPDAVKCMLLFGCCIVHPSVMIRKQVIDTGFSYSSLYPHGEDYALWVHIAEQYEIANIPEVLLKYRRTKNQISNKYAKEQFTTTLKVQREQICALGIEPTEEECHLHFSIGHSQFVPTLSFAHEVAVWLNKLKEGNSRYHYYPEPVFSNYLRIFWTGVCNKLMDAF